VVLAYAPAPPISIRGIRAMVDQLRPGPWPPWTHRHGL